MLIKLKNSKLNMWKEDSKGLSYVEMVIGLALLSGVLLIAYTFMSFTIKSNTYVSAKYDSTQSARFAMNDMGNYIRRAKKVRYNETSYNAVVVNDDGDEINIHVDIDNDGICELVQYRLDDKKLVKGYAELGRTPTTWYTVINCVYNYLLDSSKPIFIVDGYTVNIELYIKDEAESLSDPICVNASYTIRSKGAME